MLRCKLSLLALTLVLVAACRLTRPVPSPSATALPVSGGDRVAERVADPVAVQEPPAGLDTDADPCVDFARHACGSPRPASQRPQERRLAMLRALLEESASAPGEDPERKLLGDFHAACMDAQKVEAAGVETLRPLLLKIASVRDSLTFMRTAGELHSIGVPVLFRVAEGIDPQDPARTLVRFEAGAFGLGDPGAYLGDEPAKRARRDAYRAHLVRLNELLGQARSIAELYADEVVRFETALARIVTQDGPEGAAGELCAKTVLAGLDALPPRLPWRTLLQGAGTSDLAAVALCSRKDFEGIAQLLHDTRQRPLQAYLRAQLALSTAPLLGRAFADEARAIGGEGPRHALPEERWRTCVQLAEAQMGDLLGKLYAREHGAPERVARAAQIALETRDAFVAGLAGLAGVDGATRRAVSTAQVLAGAPAHPRDLSALRPERDTLVVNVLEARNLEFKRIVKSSGGALDADLWPLPAFATEARFDPARGRIYVPAGLLETPSLDSSAPASAAYATVGASVGRALARAFTPAPGGEAGSACVHEALEARGGAASVQDALVELGALHAALRAFRKGRTGASAGAGGDRLFFVAYAQDACARADVNALVALTPEFARAFRCAASAPLRVEPACPVW